MNTKNAEFQNSILAQIYEDLNTFDEDEAFWLERVSELWINSVVDFWCWSGLFTVRLLGEVDTIVGIEPSWEMLKIARTKDNSEQIQWMKWSTDKLDWIKTDLVLMTSHVSQFLVDDSEWKEFLSKAYESLNIWGYLLFDSKNPLLKPWENYTREKTNRTKETKFGHVNIQVEVKETVWNIITHSIHYKFIDTWEQYTSDNTLVYKTKEELEKDLLDAWFTISKIYWDWDGDEYTPLCREMIFLAQKK